MSREYGKVATRFWTDARVLSLEGREKLVFLFLLAGTQSNCVGCFRCTSHHIAADAVCSAEEAEQALARLAAVGLIERDVAAGLVWLPRWLRYNPLLNPNMGKSALMDLLALPASPLLACVVESLQAFATLLPKGWQAQLAHLFPNPLGNEFGKEEGVGLGNAFPNPIPSPPIPTHQECVAPSGAPRAPRNRAKRKPRETMPPEAERLARLLADRILARDPKAKVDAAGWAPEIERLHRLDSRDWQEIERVLLWTQADSFEQTVVLSAGKLRKRFTELLAKAKRAGPVPLAMPAPLRDAAEARLQREAELAAGGQP